MAFFEPERRIQVNQGALVNPQDAASQSRVTNHPKFNGDKSAKVYGQMTGENLTTSAVKIAANDGALLIYRDENNCDTVNKYDLSFAASSVSKWDRLNVCYYDESKGNVLSSQCIWLNKKIRDKILNSRDITSETTSILASREVVGGRTISSTAFTRVPVAIADPKSAVVYGCNIFVAVN